MKKLKVAGLILLLAVVLSFAVLLSIEEMLSLGLCGEEADGEVRSPDGTYVAVRFIRSCGATTPFAPHVNLREAHEEFSPGWDGTIEKGEVFVTKGLTRVGLVWESPTHLIIECRGCPTYEIYERKHSRKNVAITYRLK